MFEQLFSSYNLPFLFALCLGLGLTALEIVLLSVGGGGSGDSALSLESSFGDAPSLLTGPVQWLGVGKVPVLVLLILLVCLFGILGIATQSVALWFFGSPLSPAFCSLVVLFPTFYCTAKSARFIGRLFPKVHTTAVSSLDLLGRPAQILQGTARSGLAAEAKVIDSHGHAHYILIEPKDPSDTFLPDDIVVPVSLSGAIYLAVFLENKKLNLPKNQFEEHLTSHK